MKALLILLLVDGSSVFMPIRDCGMGVAFTVQSWKHNNPGLSVASVECRN